MRALVVFVLFLGTAIPSLAQVQSRPTDPPIVTAANESWFVLREPIAVAGDIYYPAGATVFFNGNTMVRSGHYNGVPIYSDTTIEPFSVVLVPVTRGMMQPYERLRAGALAGTTGSRTPSFPVHVTPDVTGFLDAIPMVAVAPTAVPQTLGGIGVYTADVRPAAVTPAPAVAPVVPTAVIPTPVGPLVTTMRPESNDGVWIRFRDETWIQRGAAVPYEEGVFTRVGDYAGFPVYARAGMTEAAIYVPTRAGMLARYRVK